MPTYEYRCRDCEAEWLEAGCKVDDKESPCLCGSVGIRQISINSFQLKGDKWEKKSGY